MENLLHLLDRALAAHAATNYGEAHLLGGRYVIFEPQSFKAWSLLGTLEARCSKLDRAVICFKRAVQSNEIYDPRAWMNLARAFYSSRQLVHAKATLDLVLDNSPTHYPAQFELARLHLEAKQFEQATALLYAVASRAPIDWPPLEILRKHLFEVGQWSVAIPFLGEMAARRGTDETFWFHLFDAATRADQGAVATLALRRMLLVYPQAKAQWRNFEVPHLVQGAGSEMRNFIRAGVGIARSNELLLIRWAYYFRLHDSFSGIAMVLNIADRLAFKHPRLAPFRAWFLVINDQFSKLSALVSAFTRAGHNDIIAWNDLGLVIESVKNFGATRKFYRLAHQRFPRQLTLLHNLAQAEVDVDNLAVGRDLACQILVQEPLAFRSLNLLGLLESAHDAPKRSVLLFRRCLIINPGWPTATLNLGLQLPSLGDRVGALRAIRSAIALNGDDYPQATYNLALELMASGQIADGFRHYRMRWRAEGFLPKPRPFPQAEWPGPAKAAESHLAVYMEQGLGDEVMYSWYFEKVLAASRSLTVECDQRLVSIFMRSFPSISFVPREDPLNPALIATKIQYQSPLATLPEFYAPELNEVIRQQQAEPKLLGRRHLPRLTVDPERLSYWQHYLKATFGDRPCLGVFWRSALRDHKRNKQYLTPAHLITAIPPGFAIVNLQYSYDTAETAVFSALGPSRGVHFETPPGIDLKDDLDDLFALIQCLDGVVGPLISVPWMAAAVGTPAFVLRTEAKGYIWQQFNTSHVPWAPSMRLFFRAPTTPWGPILGDVKQTLVDEFLQPI